ncbi:MAG TPA: hypothetical protein VM165_08610 [Planctomycetaceae bacterium]|nr:hypothetical protein [Planctomycetaceae bacterium]
MNLTLTDADRLEIRGELGNPAVLEGQYHRIRSDNRWTGSVRLTHCRNQHVGKKENYSPDRKRLLPDCEAFFLDVAGTGDFVFEDCVFEESNSIEITNREQSVARFQNNTVLHNMLYPIDKAAELSRGFLIAKGTSTERKSSRETVFTGGAPPFTHRTGSSEANAMTKAIS